MSQDAGLVLVADEDALADGLAGRQREALQARAFGQGEDALVVDGEEHDRRVVDDLAQARFGGVERLGGVARLGHVNHEAEQMGRAVVVDGVRLGAEPALGAVGADEAVLDVALPAVFGHGAERRQHRLALGGVQPLDQELRIVEPIVGVEAETRQRAASGKGELQRRGDGFEDDRVEAAKQIDRRRVGQRTAGAA